jgi:hypothetical protein
MQRPARFFGNRATALGFLAATSLALAFAGPIAASDPGSSCSGLASSSRAGQPGAEPQVQLEIQANDEGLPPGVIESEFSQNHLGSADACLA